MSDNIKTINSVDDLLLLNDLSVVPDHLYLVGGKINIFIRDIFSDETAFLQQLAQLVSRNEKEQRTAQPEPEVNLDNIDTDDEIHPDELETNNLAADAEMIELTIPAHVSEFLESAQEHFVNKKPWDIYVLTIISFLLSDSNGNRLVSDPRDLPKLKIPGGEMDRIFTKYWNNRDRRGVDGGTKNSDPEGSSGSSTGTSAPTTTSSPD